MIFQQSSLNAFFAIHIQLIVRTDYKLGLQLIILRITLQLESFIFRNILKDKLTFIHIVPWIENSNWAGNNAIVSTIKRFMRVFLY